jgi:ubiquinone/menaquinone biosynthesis C-methylase UbiE
VSNEAGLVFDRAAEAYERGRRGYPESLLDAACETLELGPASGAVEIGCGTGKLTRDLIRRVGSIDALDPGGDLLLVARRHVDQPTVRFLRSRFEDADLPAAAYDAAFSATAFHWVDPSVGWSKVARILRPGGGLALLTHTVELEVELLAAWRDVLPAANGWESRDPITLWAGADERRENVSELWAWITKSDIARPEAAALFRDVRLRRERIFVEQTVDDALAQVRTQSAYLELDPRLQNRLERRISSYIESVGGTYRPTVFAVLATARTDEAAPTRRRGR